MKLTLLAAAAAAVATAHAPGAARTQRAAPTPCAGYLITDKAGDQAFDASGLGLSSAKAQPNADITGLFFDDQGGKLTANIEIAKLDKTLPSPTDAQGGIWYYVIYNYKGAVHFVRAALTATGVEYASGTIDTGSGTYTTDSDPVTGSFNEGDKGVVSIEVPAAAGGKEGETLGLATATADYIQGANDQAGINNHVDTAPDNYTSAPNGKNYTVAPCGSAPTGPSGPTGPAGPGPSGPSGPPAGPAPLPFRAANVLGKAAKTGKGQVLTVQVRSTKPILRLAVTLKAATGTGATLAGGRLAQLNGTGKLKLTFKRKLKKGRYELIATGTADGSKRTARQPVLLK